MRTETDRHPTATSAPARGGATDLVLNDENNIEDMFLTFGVADEEYGIGIGHVTEIVGMQRIMEVPDVPPYIRGVINLRGKVIPVMDVRTRFNMPRVEYTERTVIIVLDMEAFPVGLIVDHVSEVVEIPAGSIDPSPAFQGGHRSDGLVMGLGKYGDRVAILLHLENMVAADVANIQNDRQAAVGTPV